MAVRGLRTGNRVVTTYGEGVIVKTRPEEGVCVVRLAYGTLYVHPAVQPVRKALTPEEINASFEAYEKIRKANWELECEELGIPCDHLACQECIREKVEKEKTKAVKSSSFIPSMKLSNPLKGKKKTEPCLLCATPTCIEHASKTFAKEKVVLCLKCESLLQYDERLLQQDTTVAENHLGKLIEAYDRAFLILRFSAQALPQLTEQLQAESDKDDKVTLGTSSVGFLSGAMGLVGAAAILTPAGPPLLLASFVTGTSNAAVGLGYNTHKYWNSAASPTQVANRLLTLYGLLQAALEILVTLRAETMDATDTPRKEADGRSSRNAYLRALSQSVEATKRTNTAMRITNAAGYTTAGSIFDVMGATPVVGQAFSAAMMVLDYQTATSVLNKMRAGSKSEKAALLQSSCDLPALMKMPTTADLETEVHDILQAWPQKSS